MRSRARPSAPEKRANNERKNPTFYRSTSSAACSDAPTTAREASTDAPSAFGAEHSSTIRQVRPIASHRFRFNPFSCLRVAMCASFRSPFAYLSHALFEQRMAVLEKDPQVNLIRQIAWEKGCASNVSDSGAPIPVSLLSHIVQAG